MRGRRFGQYEILRELGHGGQGSVYLAQDRKLGRKVALKVLSQSSTLSERSRLRFMREAETASRIDHPSICTVYEYGEHEGMPYIAMQAVDGVPLDRSIAATRTQGTASAETYHLDVEDDPDESLADASGSETPAAATPSRTRIVRILRIVEATARALHVAHEAGLVHRDIKPANIMVVDDETPIILDFGLAHMDDDESPDLTNTGDFMGTPAYMSPEQLLAQRVVLDRRTDVYSLGVTLYECLTLARPFDAPTREALYQQILTSTPADPRRINPAVSKDLKIVLQTALEKDRDRRYQTALEFAEELRRVQMQEPIKAVPPGLLERCARWCQRHPERAIAFAAVLLLFMVAVGLGSYSVGAMGEAEAERGRRELEEKERRRAEEQQLALTQQNDDRVMKRRLREASLRGWYLDLVNVFREYGFSDADSEIVVLSWGIQPTDGIAMDEYLDAFRSFGLPLDGALDGEKLAARIDRVRSRDPELAFHLLWGVRRMLARLERIGVVRADDLAREIVPSWSTAEDQAAWRAVAKERPDWLALARRLDVFVRNAEDDPWRREVWIACRSAWRERRTTPARFADAEAAKGRSALDHVWLADCIKSLNPAARPVEIVKRAIELRPDLVEAHLLRELDCMPSFTSELHVWRDLATGIMRFDYEPYGQFEAEAARLHGSVAVALDPRSATPRFLLGMTNLLAGDHEAARRLFAQAVELGDSTCISHLMLGLSHLTANDRVAGLRVLVSVLENEASPFFIFGFVCNGFRHLKQDAIVIPAIRKRLVKHPDEAWLHAELGICLSNTNDPDGALVAFAEAARLEPERAIHHCRMAREHAAKKHWDDAVDADRKAYELEPKESIYRTWLLRSLQSKLVEDANGGKLADAFKTAREALEVGPEDALTHRHLSALHFLAGEFRLVESSAGRSLELGGDAVVNNLMIAKARIRQGRPDAGIDAMRKALEKREERAVGAVRRLIATLEKSAHLKAFRGAALAARPSAERETWTRFWNTLDALRVELE